MSHAVTPRPVHPGLLRVDSYLWWDPSTDDKGTPRSELFYVARQILDACRHYQQPASRHVHDLAAQFDELAKAWREEAEFFSSATQMAMHPAYQQIVGMGRDALPFILRELEREPNHWYWALKAITGVDPVPPASRGRLSEMTAAWLKWAHDEGLRW